MPRAESPEKRDEAKIDPASPHMIARSRRLRRDSTFPERLLWGRLRGRRCGGLRIRRQQPVGPYVVDFLCAEARIVIELDGQSHEGKEEPDEKRHKFLEEQGFKVVRFTNDRVLRDLLGVVKDIAFEAGIDIS